VLEIADVVDVGHEAAHPAVLAHVGHVGGAHIARLAITIGQLALEGDELAGEAVCTCWATAAYATSPRTSRTVRPVYVSTGRPNQSW
jgi:hypothetical protein